MRIAVTGAGGFIGRAVVRELTGAGHAVVALTRRVTPGGESPPGVEVAVWNPRATFDLPACDAVVHLAGETIAGRWDPAKKQMIRDSRREGTLSIVEAMGRASPRPSVFVCASAVGYYGDRDEEILTEDSPPGAGFLAEVCTDWEAEACRAESLNMRVVRSRFAVVYDREGPLRSMTMPFRFGVGGRLGDGKQWMSWVHRDDAAGLIRHMIESAGLSGPVNVTAPEPVRNEDFTRQVAQRVHRPAFLPASRSMLHFLLGEFADSILASQHVVPRAALNSGYRFRYPTLEAALASIFAPPSGR